VPTSVVVPATCQVMTAWLGIGGTYAPPPASYEAPDMFADDGLMLGMPLEGHQRLYLVYIIV
jgi:hypothetical protein